MKKTLLSLLICLMAFPIFQGCTSLLEEENIREPVADVYYKTIAGFNDLVEACYPFLRPYYGREEGYTLTTFGTDIWIMGADGSHKHYNLYDAGIQPSNGILWEIWRNFYLGISACNTAIGRADEVQGLTDAAKKDLVGQALFLRAMYYHILVMQFGAVPLRTEEVKQVETTATRAPEADVYKQIIDDLLLAEQYLPATQAQYGRATKPAAQALLARVYLTIGRWNEAATYAKKVIHDYNFSLVPDFADLWDITKEKNSEVIWAIQYTADERLNAGTGHRGHLYFLMEYDIEKGMTRDVANGRPWKRFMPSRYYVDMLDASRELDSRYDKSWKEVWYANNPKTLLPKQKLGDTAVYTTTKVLSAEFKAAAKDRYAVYDRAFYYGNGEVPIGKRSRYPSLNKFIDPLRPTMQHEAGRRDFFVFRLAEMHLIAAEALMMQGKQSEGVTYINIVRRRAAWPGKEAQMEITADQLTLDFILEERAKELAGEFFRWPDLKRTGKLIERVKMYNPDGRNNIKEMHLVRPIPQNEMDRVSNKDQFIQNPGY